MFSSFFGSPFGTVIYIGHPAYKRSGALVGYSVATGTAFLIFSWFGLLAVVQSLVNQATIGPIVLFVGLMINEEALAFMPARHHSAYVLGLFPSIYDWTVNVSFRSPLLDEDTGGNVNDVGSNSWYGVQAWKRGALLISFVWVSMIVFVIDRQWKKATIWAMIGAAFAAVGIIHVPVAGFENFTSPTWEQCTGTLQSNNTYRYMYIFDSDKFLYDLQKVDTKFLIVSDGGLCDGNGSFGVVMGTYQSDLAMIEGPAPGNELLNTSLRSEAYGLLAGLAFLNLYTQTYDVTFPIQRHIQLFSDNLGLVCWIAELLNHSTYPRMFL